ncbi:hypothetical protein L198_07057 [Cryptococcus wingfieldii CBS 7118]|uniref:Uncharacterized protein n=1 Tax=Cryptococcus wingfieldii CBS 7118 TaxID=1295528 RepID=A0A1E3IFP9_9TREE|nr:hypothetical protein L198_07057 [Cryptococcus wingfieldii CBS 7118]ODN87430.1 hypothetical protein L198_07057 [Cryptococcus wingfieldii CBS 7118]
MSEENPSREDDQQQDSYLGCLPDGVNLGFDVAAFPPSYSNSPAPFDPTSSSDPTTSSVAPTGAAFSQALSRSRRRPSGQHSPLSTPPRVSGEAERKTAFSEASLLYARWHTSWSKPQELDRVMISAVSNCMTEPTEEEFFFKWDEANRKVESATELISKLPPPSTTEPEGGFF